MVIRHSVEGYDNFNALIKELEAKKLPIYVLFSGALNATTGKSWCPDCVAAEPVIESALANVSDDNLFLYVGIERDFWKDPKCPFRTDKRMKLTCVPTLMQWGKAARLGDSECSKKNLVQLLFEEE